MAETQKNIKNIHSSLSILHFENTGLTGSPVYLLALVWMEGEPPNMVDDAFTLLVVLAQLDQ